MTVKRFRAKLIRPEGTGTWTYFNVPFSVKEEFGTNSQVRAKGTVNGVAFRSTLMPGGGGTHYMVVNQTIREEAGVAAGDEVDVELERDTEARELIVPEDLKEALQSDEAARRKFEAFSYSHKKEYVDWIESAKRQETRIARIQKAMAMLAEGKKLK